MSPRPRNHGPPGAIASAGHDDGGTTRARPLARGPRVRLPLLVGGLALAYLPSYLSGLLGPLGVELGWGPAGVIVWNWLAVALLALYVWRVERLGQASLRLVRPTERDLEWAGWIGGAAVLWHWAGAQFLTVPPGSSTGGETLVTLGPAVALALVLTTAVTEEILWRGYVVERLGAWIGPVVAAAIGLTVFTLGHVTFFGAGWLVSVLPGAAATYALLLWRRNLYACMLCHAIGNVPIVAVALAR